MGDKGKYKLRSGATLKVNASDYERCVALNDAFLDALRGGQIGALDVAVVNKAVAAYVTARVARAAGQEEPELGPDDAAAADAGMNVLVDRMLALVASKPFKAALFACCDKAVYCPSGEVDADAVQLDSKAPGYGLFDHPTLREQARGDFLSICRALGEENLRPFVAALLSEFLGLAGKSAASPTSSSVPA